jgi:uncharacterized repeat protein (TIGR01451 family)
VRHIELRLSAIARDLDLCRRTLSEALAAYELERRRRRDRHRRVLVMVAALGASIVVGLAGAESPGLGAVRERAVAALGPVHSPSSPCTQAHPCANPECEQAGYGPRDCYTPATTQTTTTATGTTRTETTVTGKTGTGTTSTTSTATTGTTTGGTTTVAGTTIATGATTPPGSTAPATPVPPPGAGTTDLAITKVSDRASAVVGQQITYLVTVTNTGTTPAADVVVVDQLPAQVSLVSVSDGACTGSVVVECSFGTLVGGSSRAVTIVVLARGAGAVTNVATATTSTPETTTANNRADVGVDITGPFVPPRLPCATVKVRHGTLLAGRRTTVVATVHRDGRPAAAVRVRLRAPGTTAEKVTNADGVVRFSLAPRGVGLLHLVVVQRSGCAKAPAEVPVPGAFRPPQLTG